MAVFTAIAAAITGAITGAGFAAAFAAAGTLTGLGVATSLLAGGLAIATAKASGVFKAPGVQASKDPGVKIQLNPSTDNRIPVFYGRNVTGAIAVDAGISNQNNTMIYVMVIGEKTDSGTYSINNIYRGDAKLNFSGASVTSITDPNATSSTNVNGKMRCRVYAGNAQSSVNQIFPTTSKVAASTRLSTITSSTNYEDLVYAVFELDYDPENGLTGLGTLTFDITNSLSEPSNVILDYMQNSRYGAGLSSSDIDTDSFDDLYDYATAQVNYQTTANVTLQHDRWKIDGMLSTYVPVKDNIDQLCQSCATFFTYDPKGGKFKVVPNRAATTAEKNAAFSFTDDNILSAITVSSTELYSLYNSIEAEYPEVNKKDQTNTVIVSTPPADRNTNEPDNPLDTRYDMVNDRPRVHNLANIDLRQSRLSTVCEFDADYSAIQVDVGDIVKLTNTKYGFSEKLFRAMRVTEMEKPDGTLSVAVVLLEYADSIYEHNNIQTDGGVNYSLIPGWWTGIWGNIDYSNIANIVNGNVLIVDDPTSGNANIVDSGNGNVTGNVGLGNTNIVYPPHIPPGDPIINIPIVIPNIPDIAKICTNLANMNVAGINQPGHFCFEHVPGDNQNTFTPGANVTLPIAIPTPPVVDPTIPTLPISNDFDFDIDIDFLGFEGERSAYASIPQVPVKYGGKVNRGVTGPVQAGLQEDEVETNVTMANAQTTSNVDLGEANSLINTPVVIDLGGIDYGEFSSVNSVLPFGFADPGGNELAYVSQRTITYKEIDIDPVTGKHTANANADLVDAQAGQGVQATFTGAIPPGLTDNFNYEISLARAAAIAAAGGLPPISATKTYLANTMTISHFGNSDLSASGGSRGMRVTNQDKRISRSDDYLPVIPIGSIGP